MSRYGGEESLSRALPDGSSLVHTQVREAPSRERGGGGEGGRTRKGGRKEGESYRDKGRGGVGGRDD